MRKGTFPEKKSVPFLFRKFEYDLPLRFLPFIPGNKFFYLSDPIMHIVRVFLPTIRWYSIGSTIYSTAGDPGDAG